MPIRSTRTPLLAVLLLVSCDDAPTKDGPGAELEPGDAIGAVHAGQYHLGPVDFAETEYHNACAPYAPAIRELTGNLIAGVSNTVATPGSLCDACIEVTTGAGRSAVLRVVTYGVSGSDGDLDLSPAAFEALHAGEYPRAMSWQLVECGNGAPMYLQFQTGAHRWWTSLWIRNPSQAIAGVAVRNAKYPSYQALTLGTDGTYTDGNGFGEGPFSIRVTGVSGAVFEFEVAGGVVGGALIDTGGNLPL